jgi:monoamine oxidase
MDRRAQVIIVGAGLAGLSLARRLLADGVDVLVLEARDRVGGRTLSESLHGEVFEFGAQWVGPSQPRVNALLGELGLKTFAQYDTGRKVVEFGGKVSSYKGEIPKLPLLGLLQTEWLIRRADRMAAKVSLDAPHLDPTAIAHDGMSVEGFKRMLSTRKDTGALLDSAVRTVFGVEPAALSLLYFLYYLRSAGGFRKLIEIAGSAQQDRVKLGTQQMSLKLAAEVGAERLIVSAPVRRIDQKNDEIIVESDAGRFAAERVVLAIPPHLAGRIRFEPALEPRRDQLLQRWGMGATVKVYGFYAEPSWRARGLSGEAVSTTGPFSVVFDASHEGGVGCLLGFVVGKHALRWGQMAEDERRQIALSEFERLLGVPATTAIDFRDKDWCQEPWTGGCPVSTMGPGVLSQYGDIWRQPMGRVHFAGTETASVWHGFMEGALQSAERAHAEILSLLG